MKTLIIALMACATSFTAASAHAFLDHADPKVGSSVNGSPAEVKIWFTEKLIVPFSTVKVTDAGGAQVDKGDRRVDPSDGQLLIVGLKPLKPGKYQVAWRVTAVDTHVTSGTFTFDVTP
jgi:methionine-rich copper-binding protein CopC